MVDVVPTSLGFASPFDSQSYQRNAIPFEESGPDAGGGAPRSLMQDYNSPSLPSKSGVKQALETLESPEEQARVLDRNRPTELSSAIESRDTALPSGPPSERGFVSRTNTGSTPDRRDEASGANSVISALRGAVYNESESEPEDMVAKSRQRIRERKQREREADLRHQEELARRREEKEAHHEDRLRRVEEERRKQAMAKRREEELRRVQDQEAKRLRDERRQANEELAAAEHRKVQARLKAQKQKEQRERAEKEEREAEEKRRVHEEMERKAAEAQVLAKRRLAQQRKVAEEQKAERENIEVIEKEYVRDVSQDKKAEDLQRRAQARLQRKIQEEKRVAKERKQRMEEERQRREAEQQQEELELQARRELAAKRAAEKQRRARSEENKARAQKEEAERLARERKSHYRNPHLIAELKAREPSPMPITEERSRLDKLKRRAEAEKLRRYGEGKNREEADNHDGAGEESSAVRGRPPLAPQGARQPRSVAASPGNRRALSEDPTRIGRPEKASDRSRSHAPGDVALSPARRALRDDHAHSSEVVQQSEEEAADDAEANDLHDRSAPICSNDGEDRATPMRSGEPEKRATPALNNEPVDDHKKSDDLEDRATPLRSSVLEELSIPADEPMDDQERDNLSDRATHLRSGDLEKCSAEVFNNEPADDHRESSDLDDRASPLRSDDVDNNSAAALNNEPADDHRESNDLDDRATPLRSGDLEDSSVPVLRNEQEDELRGSDDLDDRSVPIRSNEQGADRSASLRGNELMPEDRKVYHRIIKAEDMVDDEDENDEDDGDAEEDEEQLLKQEQATEECKQSEQLLGNNDANREAENTGEEFQQDEIGTNVERQCSDECDEGEEIFAEGNLDDLDCDDLDEDEREPEEEAYMEGAIAIAGIAAVVEGALAIQGSSFSGLQQVFCDEEGSAAENQINEKMHTSLENPVASMGSQIQTQMDDVVLTAAEAEDDLQADLQQLSEEADRVKDESSQRDPLEENNDGQHQADSQHPCEEVDRAKDESSQCAPLEENNDGQVQANDETTESSMPPLAPSESKASLLSQPEEQEDFDDDDVVAPEEITKEQVEPIQAMNDDRGEDLDLNDSLQPEPQSQPHELENHEEGEAIASSKEEHHEVSDLNDSLHLEPQPQLGLPENSEQPEIIPPNNEERDEVPDLNDFVVEEGETQEASEINHAMEAKDSPLHSQTPSAPCNPRAEEAEEEKERAEDEPSDRAAATVLAYEGRDEMDILSPSSLKRNGIYDETPRWSIVEDSLVERSEEPLELEPAHPPGCLKALTSYNDIGKAKKAVHTLGKPTECAMRLRLERSHNAVDGEDRIELERRLLQQEEARDAALADFQAIIQGVDVEYLSEQSRASVTQVVEGALANFDGEEPFREYVLMLNDCIQALTTDQTILFSKIQELKTTPESAPQEQQANDSIKASSTPVVNESSPKPAATMPVDSSAESNQATEATRASILVANDDNTRQRTPSTRPPYRRNQSPPHIYTGEPDEAVRQTKPQQDAVESNIDVAEKPISEYPVSARDHQVLDVAETSYPLSAREPGGGASANSTPGATEPKDAPLQTTPMPTTSASVPHPLGQQSEPHVEQTAIAALQSTPMPTNAPTHSLSQQSTPCHEQRVPTAPSSRPPSRPPASSRPTSRSSRPLSRQQSESIATQAIPLGSDPLGALVVQRQQAEAPQQHREHPSSADDIHKKRSQSSQPPRERVSQSADTATRRSGSLDQRRDSRKSTGPKAPLAPLTTSSRVTSSPPPPAPGWTSAGDEMFQSSMTETMRRRADRVAADQQASAKDREDSLLKMLDKRQEQQRQKAVF
mmetsp:Transcript_53077/g.84428  ORF Transcript_53077/g.84428 Transcript_53077/m.84428 type:complete len:1823 (+) Transcript_53077:55-5523(+)